MALFLCEGPFALSFKGYSHYTALPQPLVNKVGLQQVHSLGDAWKARHQGLVSTNIRILQRAKERLPLA